MNNAELIKALRYCAEHEGCGYYIARMQRLRKTALWMYDSVLRYVRRENAERRTGMKNELKPCPYRVHGERTASLTISGEYYYNEYFMPCLMEGCACFYRDGSDAYCDRNGTYMRLTKGEQE